MKAVETQDDPTILHLAHKMKGIANNLGAKLLADRCADIEQKSQRATPIESKMLIDLNRIIKHSQTELLNMLDRAC